MLCWKRKTKNTEFRLRALFWVSLASITLVLWMGPPHAVYAVPLSNTAITGTQFGGLLGSSITGPNTSSDFFGASVDVISEVFAGTGLADGLNVYIYQVIHKNPSTVGDPITQFVFDWKVGAPPAIDFGGGLFVDSFYVANDGFTPPSVFTIGSEAPIGSSFSSNFETVRFDFPSSVAPFGIDIGETSFILGLFSSHDPALHPAQVVNGGPSEYGEVYSPAPEPSTLLLLGIGFAGIVIYTGFRERRKGEGSSLRTTG